MTDFIRKTSEERVKEILDASFKVFLKKGYSNTSMEDIINETSLSKGGFYYYFNNKEDIFFMILEEDTKKNINFINSLNLKGSNKEILDFFSSKVLEIIINSQNEDKLYPMFLLETMSNPKFKEFSSNIQEKYLNIVLDKLYLSLSDVDKVKLQKKIIFLSDIFHSIKLYSTIFNKNRSFEENSKLIQEFFYLILSEFY